RPGRQERDPDRRVRQGQARQRPGAGGGRARVRPAALPADLDDGLCLHPRRRAADARQWCGRRRSERHGHRGVLGNADRHRARCFPDTRQLHLRRKPGAQGSVDQESRRSTDAGPRARKAARMRARAIVLSAALLLAGCTVGPDYRRPELSVPSEFRGLAPDAPTGGQSLGDVAWWQIFQDETLQSLIRTTLAENYDVRIAAARVLQARAQVTYTRSFQAPDLSGSAAAPYQRIFGDQDRAPFQFKETFNPLASLDLFW